MQAKTLPVIPKRLSLEILLSLRANRFRGAQINQIWPSSACQFLMVEYCHINQSAIPSITNTLHSLSTFYSEMHADNLASWRPTKPSYFYFIHSQQNRISTAGFPSGKSPVRGLLSHVSLSRSDSSWTSSRRANSNLYSCVKQDRCTLFCKKNNQLLDNSTIYPVTDIIQWVCYT